MNNETFDYQAHVEPSSVVIAEEVHKGSISAIHYREALYGVERKHPDAFRIVIKNEAGEEWDWRSSNGGATWTQ